MRLFTAIQFDDAIKSRICEIQEGLRNLGQKGDFTQKDNLHLTLIFIGETPISQIDSIKCAMNEVNMPPFVIELSGLGYFERDGGDLYWLGVKENKQLNELYKNMVAILGGMGVAVANPHTSLI